MQSRSKGVCVCVCFYQMVPFIVVSLPHKERCVDRRLCTRRFVQPYKVMYDTKSFFHLFVSSNTSTHVSCRSYIFIFSSFSVLMVILLCLILGEISPHWCHFLHACVSAWASTVNVRAFVFAVSSR